jgi:hypothetical protein
VSLLDQIESGQVDTPRARLTFTRHRRGLLVTGSVDGIYIGTATHPIIVRDAEAGLGWLRAQLRRKS